MKYDLKSVLFKHQYGFQKEKFTEHATLDLYKNTVEAIEKKRKHVLRAIIGPRRRRVKTYSVVGFIVNVLRLNFFSLSGYYITNIMAGKDYVNLFYLTYDAINAIKKKDLVDYIEKMKGKVVADNQIQNLCNEIANLSDNVKSLVSTNERLTSELSIVKNVNNVLENRIVNLQNQLPKMDNMAVVITLNYLGFQIKSQIKTLKKM